MHYNPRSAQNQHSVMLAFLFLMIGFSSAQIVISCTNVTDCLSCAKSQFASEGGRPCSWCSKTNLCFDRFALPDYCDPSSTITLTDAGSRCVTVLGLPLAYGVLIISAIILVPIIIITAVILVRRRMRNKEIKKMLKHAERADSIRKKQPITVASDDVNYTASLGTSTQTTQSESAPKLSIRPSKAGRRSSFSRKSTKEVLLEEGEKSKDDSKEESRRYVPPSLDSPGSHKKKVRQSRSSVETSDDSEISASASASTST